MSETVENPMLKKSAAPDYHESAFNPPCRQPAPTFREWLFDTFTMDELIDYAEIMEAAIKRLGPRYQQDMKDEGFIDIEEGDN